MRLGLIARADNRGLGQQTWAVQRNLHPAKTMVVDCDSAQPLDLHLERFPKAYIVRGLPSAYEYQHFVDGLDAVYTAETGYGDLWTHANKAGVKTVLHANYEFLDPRDQPSVWAAPSPWHLDRFPAGAQHLPVPIELDRFPVTEKPLRASRFLHVVGRPAIHDRNGTLDLLQALQHVTATITVTVTCQVPGYVGSLIHDHNIHTPDNVTLILDSVDRDFYWTAYQHQDALILPRRFGGLCLPANEAIGAGIPVIMPDIDPNNTWLPAEWLTESMLAGDFRAKQHIFWYRTDPRVLAAKIDQLALENDFYVRACAKAHVIRQQLSWETLTPRYVEVFT
jgi:glycosyltransferase involved in cell wall biosynthesis